MVVGPHELAANPPDRGGASAIFPDRWEAYLAPIPQAERDDLMHAYHRRLTSPDESVRREAARACRPIWVICSVNIVIAVKVNQKATFEKWIRKDAPSRRKTT